METWGEEENDCATKQSSLLMRSSDYLSTSKLCNEINVTSTSTSEFDCSTYFWCFFLILFFSKQRNLQTLHLWFQC